MLKDIMRGGQKTNTAVAGNLTMIAPDPDYVGFNPTCDIGDTFNGCLVLQSGQWEIGVFGVVSISPTVISRPTPPIWSSNAGESIVMSAGVHTLESCDVTGQLVPKNGVIECNGGGFTNWIKPTYNFNEIDGRLITHSALNNAPVGDTHSIRPYSGNHYSIFMDSDKTITISNDDGEVRGSMTITLIIEQDEVGGRILTLPATWWEHGNNNPIPTEPGSIVIIRAVSTGNELVDGGADFGIYWRYWVEPGFYQPPPPFLAEQNGASTIEIGYEGDVFLHPSTDTAPATWTVLTDNYNIGSGTRLMGQTGSGVITLAMSVGDVLTWSPTGGAGNRTLTAPFDATLTKITATEWMISGFGIS